MFHEPVEQEHKKGSPWNFQTELKGSVQSVPSCGCQCKHGGTVLKKSKDIRLNQQTADLLRQLSHELVNVTQLMEILRIPPPKLEASIDELKKLGLVDEEKKEATIFATTSAGRFAIEHGLPEQLLFDKLTESGELAMRDIMSSTFENRAEANAAIGQLKRKKLIDIAKGTVRLKEDAEQPSAELLDALKLIGKGKVVESQQALEELRSRKLLTRSVQKSRLIKLAIDDKDLSKRVIIVDERTRLTPDMLASGEWRKFSFKEYNIAAEPGLHHFGRRHPYLKFLDELKQKLAAMGFKEMRGPLVELEFWNFDALFQAQDHPAREWSDVYRLRKPTSGQLPNGTFVDNVAKTHENGWETGSKGWRYKWDPAKAAQLVLRAQGTSISARTLKGLPIPSKFFSLARCFRPDVIDATHLPEFNQVEGIICDESITFTDLLGILKEFAVDVAGAAEFDFRPDFYPFTSPSVELGAIHPDLGRIEFGGAGIFRPEVTEPFGIEHPVIAWGLGVDRLFMVSQEIKDIRHLFSTDLAWLRSAKI